MSIKAQDVTNEIRVGAANWRVSDNPPSWTGRDGCRLRGRAHAARRSHALKAFTLEDGHVDVLKNKFLTEDKVLARLHDQHLVRVFDLNFDETTGTPIDEVSAAFGVTPDIITRSRTV